MRKKKIIRLGKLQNHGLTAPKVPGGLYDMKWKRDGIDRHEEMDAWIECLDEDENPFEVDETMMELTIGESDDDEPIRN